MGHSHDVEAFAAAGSSADHAHPVDVAAVNTASTGATSVDVTTPYIQSSQAESVAGHREFTTANARRQCMIQADGQRRPSREGGVPDPSSPSQGTKALNVLARVTVSKPGHPEFAQVLLT